MLVWDECLTRPIDLIAEYSVLKEHDVVKMFPLNPAGLPLLKADNVVYILRPTVENCDIIAANIRYSNIRPPFYPSRHIFTIITILFVSQWCLKKILDTYFLILV